MAIANLTFWLICQIFSSPKVIGGPHNCWPGQAKEKDQKCIFTLSWRSNCSFLQSSVTLWVETNPGPSGSHRKSFSFHHVQGLDLDHLHNVETCLLSWSLGLTQAASSLLAFSPSFFHPAGSPKLTSLVALRQGVVFFPSFLLRQGKRASFFPAFDKSPLSVRSSFPLAVSWDGLRSSSSCHI